MMRYNNPSLLYSYEISFTYVRLRIALQFPLVPSPFPLGERLCGL
jgi:hypothetical protein